MSPEPPLLSILIPTVPSRLRNYFPRMVESVLRQVKDYPVEVIGFFDNKTRSVGDKRNGLLQLANGKFLVFLDDDDSIAEDYLDSVLPVLASRPDADCLVYDQEVTRDGGPPLLCKYGIEYEYEEKPDLWTGKPAHTMIWKTELAKRFAFPNKNVSEDTDWVKVACQHIKVQLRIDKVLYYYAFDSSSTETRDRQPKFLQTSTAVKPPIIEIPGTMPCTVFCSVVMSTRNKSSMLRNTLASIFRQRPNFSYEVIVVDDGSDDQTETVCKNFQSSGALIRYKKIENNEYRNPGFARNVGYRMARGSVVVAQSDDVVHGSEDTLAKLCQVQPGTFNVATVWNADLNGRGQVQKKLGLYTGHAYKRPLFFLGALFRKDIYAIGGNCEDFTEPGYEDDWFGQCLIHGLKLKPIYLDTEGFHQHHPRIDLSGPYDRMKKIFDKKHADASAGRMMWSGGDPWLLLEE